MIVSFRCPPGLKEKMDALITSGSYPDVSSFCVTAVENQLLLEQSDSELQAPERLPRPITKRDKLKSAHVRVRSAEETRAREILSTTESIETGGGRSRGLVSVISQLRLSELPPSPPFSLAATLADVFDREEVVPVERWLFGQYNRMLPAKVSVRALAIISAEGKESLLLSAAGPRIADSAGQLGAYLRELDRRHGHHRDDSLATAFPEAGVEGQKGRLRYQNHFVGHTVKGEQGGMLVGLKLAAIQVIRNKAHILPTMAGWEFARLKNPLLDDNAPQAPIQRLSKEEALFLRQHISEHVPVELFAYRVILSLIDSGKDTPDEVNDYLKSLRSPGRRSDDDREFVATQKNGVLGRMADLGLVGRERQKTRVAYRLTPDGREFLEKVGSSSNIS
jgi:Arc/MetJ-type ribon-helix-helix transcriptional regulator